MGKDGTSDISGSWDYYSEENIEKEKPGYIVKKVNKKKATKKKRKKNG